MNGLVCVAGGKGSPGATTLALLLASRAVLDGPVTLVDADPDGGDLAALLGVSTMPGLVSLAAASRHGFTPGEIDRHTQTLPTGVRLVSGPAGADQAAEAITRLGASFASHLAGSPTVADVGRWRPKSPADGLVRAAEVVVLVVHPTVAGVAHARPVVDDLSTRCRRVVVATRGDRPYGPDEVEAAVGCPKVVVLPVDRTAAALVTGPVSGRWLSRSPLARVAAQIVVGAVKMEPVP